ncbi:prothrombin-like [Stegodyphus dumicola]|uniref:prothrombin-like n=1 Tax=Stegodyphus dumicola TaxID=202533 RepID=UPI0015A9A942|nr:prothrombin-like [Stegodyphus dumicola]
MGDIIWEAEVLKKYGVEIYTIGTASYTREKSLIEIASEPKNEHAFILQNYPALDWLSQELTDFTADYSRCGLRPKHRTITDGGNPITGQDTETWPWLAALCFTSGSEEPKIKCSGSIIHDLYILTTAHCVYYEAIEEERKENQITVHLGLTDIQNEAYEEVIDVEKIYIHEKYSNDGNYDYDIALLKLEAPIVYNAFIRPICLPPTNLPLDSILYKPNETAIATGWGMDVGEDERKHVAFRMRRYPKEVNLTLQSKENCVDFVKNKSQNVKFTERMLCAGGDGEEACLGHRGSPLMQPRFDSDGNVYWTQVGITGWSFWPCGRESSYGYYTHVQNLVSWITETIKQTINE